MGNGEKSEAEQTELWLDKIVDQAVKQAQVAEPPKEEKTLEQKKPEKKQYKVPSFLRKVADVEEKEYSGKASLYIFLVSLSLLFFFVFLVARAYVLDLADITKIFSGINRSTYAFYTVLILGYIWIFVRGAVRNWKDSKVKFVYNLPTAEEEDSAEHNAWLIKTETYKHLEKEDPATAENLGKLVENAGAESTVWWCHNCVAITPTQKLGYKWMRLAGFWGWLSHIKIRVFDVKDYDEFNLHEEGKKSRSALFFNCISSDVDNKYLVTILNRNKKLEMRDRERLDPLEEAMIENDDKRKSKMMIRMAGKKSGTALETGIAGNAAAAEAKKKTWKDYAAKYLPYVLLGLVILILLVKG